MVSLTLVPSQSSQCCLPSLVDMVAPCDQVQLAARLDMHSQYALRDTHT